MGEVGGARMAPCWAAVGRKAATAGAPDVEEGQTRQALAAFSGHTCGLGRHVGHHQLLGPMGVIGWVADAERSPWRVDSAFQGFLRPKNVGREGWAVGHSATTTIE